MVIGRKGLRIRELSDAISQKFGIDSPQIDVEAVENPELNARIMAEAIAFGIKKGQNYRRTAYSVMRRIIKAGARGVEVTIAGKSTSQRAKTQRFRAGVISKCGEPAMAGVDKGLGEAILKSGTMGVRVKIMPLDYKLPDEIILKDASLKIKSEKTPQQIKFEGFEGGDVLVDKDTQKIIVDNTVEEPADIEIIEETIFDNVEEGAEVENAPIENIDAVEGKADEIEVTDKDKKSKKADKEEKKKAKDKEKEVKDQEKKKRSARKDKSKSKDKVTEAQADESAEPDSGDDKTE